MMQLRAITEIEAHAILARELTGSEACDQVAEDCALLRSCAWALTDGFHPVHILRLLNLASALHFAGDASRGTLKEALQVLSECGDLAELSSGQWLPAPWQHPEVVVEGVVLLHDHHDVVKRERLGRSSSCSGGVRQRIRPARAEHRSAGLRRHPS